MSQAHQPPDHDAWAGAETDHIQPRPSQQAFYPGPHSWAEQALLLHSHQL